MPHPHLVISGLITFPTTPVCLKHIPQTLIPENLWWRLKSKLWMLILRCAGCEQGRMHSLPTDFKQLTQKCFILPEILVDVKGLQKLLIPRREHTLESCLMKTNIGSTTRWYLSSECEVQVPKIHRLVRDKLELSFCEQTTLWCWRMVENLFQE